MVAVKYSEEPEANTVPIQWIDPALIMPDTEISVILGLDDGEACGGFYDGDLWRYECGARIEDRKVLWWAEYPEIPA